MDAISKYCALFLRETPNPIPICLGTMSCEQLREQEQSSLRPSMKEVVRTELF